MNQRNISYRNVACGRLCRRACLATVLLCCTAWRTGLGVESIAPNGGVRTQDRVCLASTRHLGCGSLTADPALWNWAGEGWVASDAAAFHAEDDAWQRTVIYIHGNRVDDDEGASGGMTVYREVIARRADPRPVRFVIWSWPSTRICGPIKDVRSKAWRSDDEAVLLARFLAKSNAKDAHVGIVAFSYGARITQGALHMLGGGELDGQAVAAGERPRFRVALWAAAAHNDWLLPQRRMSQAPPLVDKWLNLVNGCDESLFRYEKLEKCGNPPALGYTGLAGRNQLPEEVQGRWEEWDVANLVGATHNYPPYTFSPWIADETAKCVLGDNP